MGYKNNDPCLERVNDDEPIFVLRAQDETASWLVSLWAVWNNLPPEHYENAKHRISMLISDLRNARPVGHQDKPKAMDAAEWAKVMQTYPNRKRPD